jgi:UDP:flavonoid glycosyltransferase YjiC (YdhE family)
MYRFLRQELAIQFAQLPPIIKGADLLLGASLILAAPSVAESSGVPYGFISFCPQILPSSQHPSVLVRYHNLPPWLNLLSWRFASQLDKFTFKTIINRERSRLGLKSVSDLWPHFLGNNIIVASDPVLAPVPMDVKLNFTHVGYFHLQQKEELAPELEAFLASGPPPVYVGFGSMPDEAPDAIARLALKAARAIGQRIILSQGWSRLESFKTSNDCLVIDDVPNTKLFPRVSVVVHHGGSGTTATAARAGVPQIIIPHILDQYYWANRIYLTGLGPKPIPRSRLTTEGLAVRLAGTVSNKRMRKKARNVGAVIQNNDSLGKTVKLVESEFLFE